MYHKSFTKALSHILMLLAFVVSSMSIVTVLSSAPAQADGDCTLCGTVTTGGGGNNGGGGSNSGGGETSTGGGGGTSTGGGGGSGGTGGLAWSESGQGFFPANPPGTIGGRGLPQWGVASNTYHYNNKCGGNYSWSANGGSYSAPYEGWTWNLGGIFVSAFIGQGSDAQEDPNIKSATVGGYDCIPPPEYYDYTIKCAAYADAYLVGPIFNSDEAATNPVTNFPRRTSKFESSGRTNPALCDTSYVFNFGDTPHKWGQYKLVATAHYRLCTMRTYITADAKTGSVPAAEVRGCSAPKVDDTDVAKAELFCNSPYVKKSWDNTHTFTSADCMGDNATWTCGPQLNENPTFAGKVAEEFEVLDDGETRRASWDTVQPSGQLRNITDRYAVLRFLTGSPFRSGEVKNGSTQPFFTNPKNDVTKSGWRQAAPTGSTQTSWDLAFLAPGVKGSPWTAAPRWGFTAQFKSYVPNITWDLASNTYTYKLDPVWITAPATCDGQPVKVDVSRARNSTS